MILLDTDHFSVLTDARHARHSALVTRLLDVDEPVGIPVVAVEEQLRAWLAQIRRVRTVHQQIAPYDRLIRVLDVLAEWDVARWSEAAANEYVRLQRARIRIGTQDLKIAALALARDALLLSANRRDFERVPGLHIEDWLFG
jgi:tRNA(fMet)-specific endonuclease VapC